MRQRTVRPIFDDALVVLRPHGHFGRSGVGIEHLHILVDVPADMFEQAFGGGIGRHDLRVENIEAPEQVCAEFLAQSGNRNTR